MSEYVWKAERSPFCPYNMHRCKRECKEIADAHGIELDVPVKHLRDPYGFACVRSEFVDGVYTPVTIDFCTSFFRVTDEWQCRQILLHEMAHYIVAKRTGENHQHDKYFQDVCREIGCIDWHQNEGGLPYDEDPQWVVRCDNCGRVRFYGGGDPDLLEDDVWKSKCKKCGKIGYHLEENTDHQIVRLFYGDTEPILFDMESDEVMEKYQNALTAFAKEKELAESKE